MRSGFLVIGLLLGFGIGYLVAEWSSCNQGYHWFTNSNLQQFNFTLYCFGAGALLGLGVGGALDWKIQDYDKRNSILYYGGLTVVLFYLTVMIIFNPAIHPVR